MLMVSDWRFLAGSQWLFWRPRTLCIYKPGFQFKEEALQFFRQCVGEDAYDRAMNSEVGKLHHYVAARVLLSQADWEKFVWIEEHGSLDGFPAQAP